jgi:hypothetical protein
MIELVWGHTLVIHPGPGLARALLAFSRNACTEAGTSFVLRKAPA